MSLVRVFALYLALAMHGGGATAQEAEEPAAATQLPDVVVSAPRREQQSFDAPNDRFFEPAPDRTWLLAAQVGYRFQ